MEKSQYQLELEKVRVDGTWASLLFKDSEGRVKGNRHSCSVLFLFHPDLQGVTYNEETQELTHPKEFPWGGKTLKQHQSFQIAFWCAGVLGTSKGFAPTRAWHDLVSAAICNAESQNT